MTRSFPSVDDSTLLFDDGVMAAIRTALGGSGGGGDTLVYANGAYPTRPSLPAGAVTYVGPVQPTTWLPGYAWRDIS